MSILARNLTNATVSLLLNRPISLAPGADGQPGSTYDISSELQGATVEQRQAIEVIRLAGDIEIINTGFPLTLPEIKALELSAPPQKRFIAAQTSPTPNTLVWIAHGLSNLPSFVTLTPLSAQEVHLVAGGIYNTPYGWDETFIYVASSGSNSPFVAIVSE